MGHPPGSEKFFGLISIQKMALIPIFCVFSSFTLMKLYDMVPRKWLGTLLICGILIGSVMFLDYQKVDYEYERESYLIAKEITFP